MINKYIIPNNKVHLVGGELNRISEAIESGHWQGDGPFSAKCCSILEKHTGCEVLLTTSATAALELAFMSLGLELGSEVIVPSYTFVSSANAVVRCGLKPVFVDVRQDTLNIDEALIEQAITEKTKAILVVHYAGVAAEMNDIMEIAGAHGLAVVEDAAQALNSFYKERPLGAIGDLGVYSFHQTKNISCGEGGAIVIRNKKYADLIKILRQKGTNRHRFLSGEVDRYSWVDCGSNLVMSDLLAAILLSQLESIEEITKRRKAIYDNYNSSLADLSEDIRLPVVQAKCNHNYHIFYILLKDVHARDELHAYLRGKGIEAAPHFVPLHTSKGGKKYGVVRGPMRMSEMAGDCLLRLPLYTEMLMKDQERVIESVREFYCQ